ncbi:MAG: EpsI family protein [candidate division Zixibacteria bacterium]|nr:EpsI family protein [candidate division Zixibacteria bacterium]
MNSRRIHYWIAVSLLALTTIVVNYIRISEVLPPNTANLQIIPLSTKTWQGLEYHFSDNTYQILRTDASTFRKYVDQQGNIVWLFLAYFKSQKYGSQIHSPKNCLPGSGWNILKKDKYYFKVGLSDSLCSNLFTISDGKESELMFYWFITESGIVTNEFMLKLDLVLNSLRHKPTHAAFVRMTISLQRSDEKTVIQVFENFYKEFDSYIQQALPFPKH